MGIFTKIFIWPFLCIPRVVLLLTTYFGHSTTKNSLIYQIWNFAFWVDKMSQNRAIFFWNCPKNSKLTSPAKCPFLKYCIKYVAWSNVIHVLTMFSAVTLTHWYLSTLQLSVCCEGYWWLHHTICWPGQTCRLGTYWTSCKYKAWAGKFFIFFPPFFFQRMKPHFPQFIMCFLCTKSQYFLYIKGEH